MSPNNIACGRLHCRCSLHLQSFNSIVYRFLHQMLIFLELYYWVYFSPGLENHSQRKNLLYSAFFFFFFFYNWLSNKNEAPYTSLFIGYSNRKKGKKAIYFFTTVLSGRNILKIHLLCKRISTFPLQKAIKKKKDKNI